MSRGCSFNENCIEKQLGLFKRRELCGMSLLFVTDPAAVVDTQLNKIDKETIRFMFQMKRQKPHTSSSVKVLQISKTIKHYIFLHSAPLIALVYMKLVILRNTSWKFHQSRKKMTNSFTYMEYEQKPYPSYMSFCFGSLWRRCDSCSHLSSPWNLLNPNRLYKSLRNIIEAATTITLYARWLYSNGVFHIFWSSVYAKNTHPPECCQS